MISTSQVYPSLTLVVKLCQYQLKIESKLDLVNDYHFEQFVRSPTWKSNTFDLVFSIYQHITDVIVTPGMSDDKTVTPRINIAHQYSPVLIHMKNKADLWIPLYHKADIILAFMDFQIPLQQVFWAELAGD